MNLKDCLPVDLQRPTTSITPIAAGLSGAGVYRVESDGQTFVLKISSVDEAFTDWRGKLQIRQLAADAGLAPQVIHVDEARRAILSTFILDRSFPAFYGNPLTRETALAQLGRTVRRLHEIPLPPEIEAKDPHEFLGVVWSGLGATFALPAFVGEAVQRMLTEESPPQKRASVLSHNDVNPTNLIYDGENILLLDWETAGLNDPFYDLAAIAVFFRMDDETCQKLLSAYDGEPIATLPARFTYCRRLAALLCGTIFLQLAYHNGYAGATGQETLDSTPSLGDFYQQLLSGSLSLATGEGQWWFGLALIRDSYTL